MKLSWIRRINLRIESAATSATRVSENLAPYRPRLSYFFFAAAAAEEEEEQEEQEQEEEERWIHR